MMVPAKHGCTEVTVDSQFLHLKCSLSSQQAEYIELKEVVNDLGYS